ncbi:hypothetical protein LZ198_09925 [Myxococcus sp. K15C18031901]|uniref:hypothetical protein n=1 Tax=Myxococcus dinghuensis TaxID=2906761 RepID=UPI0020A6FD06|nr:hypothetical protein [Myxococcus dinghuensis]MCP3099186.1 hypothetical protein [Myxococcus dinghuensis]
MGSLRVKWVLGLLVVSSLAACGGPADVQDAATGPLGEAEQGLACVQPDNWCPEGSVCRNGLCRPVPVGP